MKQLSNQSTLFTFVDRKVNHKSSATLASFLYSFIFSQPPDSELQTKPKQFKSKIRAALIEATCISDLKPECDHHRHHYDCSSLNNKQLQQQQQQQNDLLYRSGVKCSSGEYQQPIVVYNSSEDISTIKSTHSVPASQLDSSNENPFGSQASDLDTTPRGSTIGIYQSSILPAAIELKSAFDDKKSRAFVDEDWVFLENNKNKTTTSSEKSSFEKIADIDYRNTQFIDNPDEDLISDEEDQEIEVVKSQLMALDRNDIDLIRASWVPVRKDTVSNGVLLFRGLFTKFPQYLRFFPFFSDLNLELLHENKRLLRHATKVIDTVTFVVDSIGDESKADQLNDALVQLVKSHLKRGIGLAEFRNLGIVLIDFICDVSNRRGASPNMKSGQPQNSVVSAIPQQESQQPVIDTNALVAAWTRLYGVILDLVKREEGHVEQ